MLPFNDARLLRPSGTPVRYQVTAGVAAVRETPAPDGRLGTQALHGERVETTEAFPAAFSRALASKTGAVLDLNISPEALTPRQTLSQMRAAALAKKDAK